ncbi:MAG: hypothetical protein ACTHVY_13360 [Brevibacterium yomogidense]
MDQLRIDITDGRLSTHGFELRTRPLDDGTEVRLVPLSQTVSDPAVLYTRLLADTADPVAFLETVEPVDGSDSAVSRVRLDPGGRVVAGGQRSPVLTVRAQWEDPPQSFLADARIPVSTVLLERALRMRGALVTRTDRNFLVGSAPDGAPLLVKDARSHLNGLPAVHAAERKDIARALLARTGVAIPAGTAFDRTANPAEAFELLERLGALGIKPVDGDKGRGVTVGVTGPDGLREAWDLALHETRAGVLVEEVRSGEEVRVLVIDGRAQAVARRIPPHVTGDGERTIRELVNAKNAQRQESFFLRGKPIPLTPHRLRLLAGSGLTPLSILDGGRQCDLDVTGNVRTGAEPVDATDAIDPSYLRIAERAVAAVPGLRIAGVDLIGTDLATPAIADDHVVIELNPNPGLGIHAGARGGERRDIAGAIAVSILGSASPATATPSTATSSSFLQSAAQPAPHASGSVSDAGTSEGLLAAAFRGEGFTVEWVSSRGFFARRADRVHGIWGATTDRSAHSAVFALKNPNAVHEVLEHAAVPLLEGRGFTRFEREEARAFAAQWGRVAVHGGVHRPIMVDATSADAFAAAWDEAADHATVRGMRVTRAPSGPRRRVLVAHGEVLAVVEEALGTAVRTGGSALVDAGHDHDAGRGPGIAVAAVAALPGLDLAEVVVGPAIGGVAVVHIRADPDLGGFRNGATRTPKDIAHRIVALHVGLST